MYLIITEAGDECQTDNLTQELKEESDKGYCEIYSFDGERFTRWNGEEFTEIQFRS